MQGTLAMLGKAVAAGERPSKAALLADWLLLSGTLLANSDLINEDDGCPEPPLNAI